MGDLLTVTGTVAVDKDFGAGYRYDVSILQAEFALTQVLEPFVSHLANPLTDAICREGLQRAGRSLRTLLLVAVPLAASWFDLDLYLWNWIVSFQWTA